MRLAAAPLVVMMVMPAFAVAEPMEMAAYRAVYELNLDSSQPAQGVDRIGGRIAIETRGTACEGYTTDFRQVAEIGGAGGAVVLDTRLSNFEDLRNRSYRFTSETYRDKQKVEDVQGMARRDNDALAVTLKSPTAKNLTLTGKALFPTEHMKTVLAAAEAGQSSLEAPVYDGGEKGEKVFYTFAVIGKKIEGGATEPDMVASKDERLKALPHWRVNISYFDPDKTDKPAYTMGFDLYRNGVSRALSINYGEFALKGTLSQLEWLPQDKCP